MARSTRRNPPKRKTRHPKRIGKLSKTGITVIKAAVQDNPHITERQVTALSKVVRHSKDLVKDVVIEAQLELANDALDYVRYHKQSVVQGLASDNIKGLEVAQKGAAWALEHLGVDGARVVEAKQVEATGSRILIGIKIGGVSEGVNIANTAEIRSE